MNIFQVYPAPPPDEASADSSTQNELSGLVCYIVGLLVRLVLDLAKYHIAEFLNEKHPVIKALGGWIYTAIFAFAGVSFWRGIWYLMELDVGEKKLQLSLVLAGSLVLFLMSKVSRSLISAPLSLCLDSHENTFLNATYFRQTPQSKIWFVVDVLFTNIVIRQLIVFCWWSLWSLENIFLINNVIGVKDADVAWDSIILGYFTTFIAFGMDKMLLASTTRKQYITKPLQFLTTLIAFFASVNVWRGIWSLYDNYLFPSVDKDLNYIVSAIIGFLVLSVTLLSNSVCNDQISSDLDEGEIVSIKYWRLLNKRSPDNEELVPILE